MFPALVLLLLLISPASPAVACGPDTDCVLGDRIYRIRIPEDRDATRKIGAIVFAHGYRGSARGVMRNKRLADVAASNGLALIALKSAGADWKIPGTPSDPGADGRIELEYVDALL